MEAGRVRFATKGTEGAKLADPADVALPRAYRSLSRCIRFWIL
jgi:hypothetical protein